MRSRSLVIAASSELDIYCLVVRMLWLLAMFFHILGVGLGLEAWSLYRCALSELKVVESSLICAYLAISWSRDK